MRVLQTEGLQIGDHRLSITCGVVERLDHHCGDDLVNSRNDGVSNSFIEDIVKWRNVKQIA